MVRVADGEVAAALWWSRLQLWEQDEVRAWWHDRSLPFPLSAGMKQAQVELVPIGDPADEMAVEVLTFLQTHFAS